MPSSMLRQTQIGHEWMSMVLPESAGAAARARTPQGRAVARARARMQGGTVMQVQTRAVTQVRTRAVTQVRTRAVTQVQTRAVT